MKQYLDSADFVSLERLLTYVTEENNDPQIGIFRCVLYIIRKEWKELVDASLLILQYDKNYPHAHLFLGVGYLGMERFDFALDAFKSEYGISSFSTNAVWLIPYTMLLQKRLRQADEWILKLKTASSLPDGQEQKLRFIELLSQLLQGKDINSSLTHFNNSRTDSSSNGELCLPHFEELLRRVLCPVSTKESIVNLAKKLKITSGGFVEDFRYNTQDIEERGVKALEALEEKNYMQFLDFLGTNGSPVYKKLSEDLDLESTIGENIFHHTQQLILLGHNDSLAIYGEKMIEAIPSHFQGYILTATYNRNLKNYAVSDSLFDMAIARVKNSNVVQDPETIVKRIRQIKLNR